MRIVGLCGSLRGGSSNHLLLRTVPKVAPALSMQIYEGLAMLPHFSPDLDVEEAPDSVRALRVLVGSADGVIVSSPEYAHGIPGSLKNALDWLVSSGEFMHKPVVLWSASPSGADYVHPQLMEVLRVMTARVVDAACLRISSARQSFDVSGHLIDPKLALTLDQSLLLFAQAIATP